MRRLTAPIVVSCAAACVLARLVWPATGLAAELVAPLAALFAWVAWRADGARAAAAARAAADDGRRCEALFEACGGMACAFPLVPDGRPGRLQRVNETACMALGHPRAALLEMAGDELFAPEVRSGVLRRLGALTEAESLTFESSYVAADGQRLPVEVSLRRVDTATGPLCLSVARDLATPLELASVPAGRPAGTDALTGLASRLEFFAAVPEVRKRARRLGARVLVLHVELVGLADANERLGHAAGDALVQTAAATLRATFRDDDLVARIGGDEFVAVAVLGRGGRRLHWSDLLARFDAAAAEQRAELAGELLFAVRRASRVAGWEELDDVDALLARTRAGLRSRTPTERRRTTVALER